MSSSSAYHFPTNALILKGPRALLHVDRLHMHVVRVDKSHQEMERLRREKGFNYFVDPSAPHASEYARFFTECNGDDCTSTLCDWFFFPSLSLSFLPLPDCLCLCLCAS